MEYEEVISIINAFSKSHLFSLEISRGDTVLKLERPASQDDKSHDPVVRPSGIEHVSVSADASHDPMSTTSDESPASDGPTESSESLVTSPLHGIFHAAEKPSAPPLVAPGDRVKSGQTLGVLEAMKMFHDLRATRDGVVEEIFCSDGEEVEVNKPLFRIV